MPSRSCLRDDEGWRIPKRYTYSWYIYTWSKKGWPTKRIAKALGTSRVNVAVLRNHLKSPEKTNAIALLRVRRMRERHGMTKP